MKLKLLLSLMGLSLLFFTGCAGKNGAVAVQNTGDIAHDFTLPDQNGNDVTLSEVLKTYDGAVIAFYPKAGTKN